MVGDRLPPLPCALGATDFVSGRVDLDGSSRAPTDGADLQRAPDRRVQSLQPSAAAASLPEGSGTAAVSPWSATRPNRSTRFGADKPDPA
jgi:hypothetical protein